MKCYLQKPSEVERKWYLVDAKGKTLGRLSTEIATVLRGKNKVTFTPNVDGGDYVVVINAEQVQVTGKKRQNKVYRHHTGYIGNLKEINFDKLLVKNPTKLINNKLFVPANILSKYMGYSLSFDKSKNNLLINSTATNLMDKPDFSKISLLPVLEKSMGKETYNQFKYTFVTTDEPKGEKYLTNGKYAIFTAHEKGYEPNKLNGFFYLNIYTNDVYFYPASSEHEELAISPPFLTASFSIARASVVP